MAISFPDEEDERPAARLLASIALRCGPKSSIAENVPALLSQYTGEAFPERGSYRSRSLWWSSLSPLLTSLVTQSAAGDLPVIWQNAERIGGFLGLSRIEIAILEFIALAETSPPFGDALELVLKDPAMRLNSVMAGFAGVKQADVAAALKPSATLRHSGLIETSESIRREDRDTYTLANRLAKVMSAPAESIDDLLAKLFPQPTPAVTRLPDFAFMAESADLIKSLIQGAFANKAAGVNVLLYGAPGTGKTEFCKALADEIGATLFAVGEADSAGDEPTRGERLADLRFAGRMLAQRPKALLLWDEMEDFFDGVSHRRFGGPARSKVFANRLLETNPIPTLWTTNSLSDCDPAFLRRMTFSVEMRPPAQHLRQKHWQRLAEQHPSIAADDGFRRLAEVQNLPLAQVSDALRGAALCGGGFTAFQTMLEASVKLVGKGNHMLTTAAESPWNHALANTDIDLVRLEDRLVSSDQPPRVSFCLHGPAGTGKSAWARHLAKKLGMPVLQKRASDLISKWVGDNEKAIAQAFAEAQQEGALLIFDEADSLLGDRRHASQHWEISQINEMLTWMESHRLPFVCTTNLVGHLDPATQRRFTFRIRFDWLRDDQLPIAWRAHFNVPPHPDIARLGRLAAGDFANVSRRVQALGFSDAEDILRELQREGDDKSENTRIIGFRR